ETPPMCLMLNIPPFVPARTVLEGLESDDSSEKERPVKNENPDKKVKGVKEETGDLLRLCHTVPLEVVNMGVEKATIPRSRTTPTFEAWLQCYYVDGMKSIRDHNGRTMWFKGDPGPMAPKEETVTETSHKEKKPETDAGSKRRKTEKKKENSPQDGKTSAARRRKVSSAEPNISGEVRNKLLLFFFFFIVRSFIFKALRGNLLSIF
uniref:Endonuclease VIII-like 1 DNA binding domain-containing protein n=1 Tax=Labrus bergylta TaxID=56723 RepID=A0A3Q3FQH0_9LABR